MQFMKKSFLFTILVSIAVTGCNGSGDDNSPPPEVIPPPEVTPPLTYVGTLLTSSIAVTGEVDCNGHRIGNGTFEVEEGATFSCSLGHVELGQFTAPDQGAHRAIYNDKESISFDLSTLHGDNVSKVLKSIDSCNANEWICLNEIDAFDIEDIFQNLSDDDAVDDYLAFMEEKSTDNIGQAPSSHVDNKVVPVVDPDANDNLNSGFVSASAESTYTYKPSTESKVLTRTKLTDQNGIPISGISYFSENSIGKTNEFGEFEYLWGDTITFGIDTFEFGKVSGNQVDYKITDVTENPVTKVNIQSLIERYAEDNYDSFIITEKVQTTFSEYPNLINELINISLPNGGKLEGSDFELPNEFEDQFSNGLTAEIDNELRQPSTFVRSIRKPLVLAKDDGGYVTESLKDIFKNVTTFHVFNDNGSFYGATGYTRGMRALNISNRAFPIMMSRSDMNKEINFGNQQAWTREGKPYIAEWPNVVMPDIPVVSKDNVTFGLPFVTAGEIGSGKVVFMGNGLYPSILSCPNSFWANRGLRIDSSEKSCEVVTVENEQHNDNGSMKQFFSNLFQWFNHGESTEGLKVATNINIAYAANHNSDLGREYNFFISPEYGFGEVVKLSKNGFSSISVSDTPVLILQGYPPVVIKDGRTNQFVSDLESPNLSQADITSLIAYINEGGNVLFMDAIQTLNPEPVGRLADAAGISVGGDNVTPTNQAFCGSSYYCQSPSPNLHVKDQKEMVVLERFQDHEGEQPFKVNQDGTVEWIKDETKIKFEIPTYEALESDSDGNVTTVTKYARILVDSKEERQAAIAELQAAFKGTPICKNDYEYEFNCIETRSGHGDTVRGNYHRPDFDRYEVSQDVLDSMVKSANLGSNFTALYNHELYYRTKGSQGERLSSVELNQTYDNLSVWMWNDNAYRYETDIQDELGFKQAVQFLNCYTNGYHQADTQEVQCPVDLKASLVNHGMIHGEGVLNGQMNPSYPLNYMEKPLTRIMLGRSYWDHNIVVDTTIYPGRTPGAVSNGSVMVQTNGNAVTYSAGNNQSTGFWAPQLQEVTISNGTEAIITVMMADDLTGKAKHETSLKRPPRMQTSYQYDGSSLTFKAPYGGLIYIQPKEKGLGEVAFNLSGVEKAAWWKDGRWVHSIDSAVAPIAEVDTGSFIYTTPINNVKSIDINQFAIEMNRFADAASDFYGRDEISEDSLHRRFTYTDLKEFRHRFVNDVQISIGSAHSGYPVMNTGFNADRSSVPTNALNDWLLWHEIGHNLASAPFLADGSTEVTNNLLALYMQELDGRNENPRMDRLIFDIKKAPMWLDYNSGNAWSNGDAGMRLVMFGQLKVWAELNFTIDEWYRDSPKKPSIYGTDEGWNMFKLMHRKARGDKQGDEGDNYCSSHDTGLFGGDLMMVCSSYVSGYDLSEFFTTWNVGETSMTNPDGTKVYNGGISHLGLSKLQELQLDKPQNDPLKVDSIDYIYN